jgi:acyl phosphate:glycerol-3-phosphate acyltransferase
LINFKLFSKNACIAVNFYYLNSFITTMTTLLACLVAYLIGSLSFAVIVSKAMGLPDPHTYGSGNPGATNVLRSGSKKAAILTLLLDATKGWLAVFLAKWLAPSLGLDEWAIAGVALSVFLGHLFPVFYQFAGGKGVATAAGVLLAINPWLGLATLATWLSIAACFRYSSLAALMAAIFAPLYTLWLFGTKPMLWAVLAMCVLLIWRHKANIQKLIAGEESHIGSKK